MGKAAAVVAVIVVLVVAMSGGDAFESTATGPTSTTASSTRTTSPATSEPTSAPPAPANVDDAALPGLLLSANDVSGRMNKPGMTAMPTEYEPLAGSVAPPNCTGAWGPAYQATYDGSGFTGLVVQGVFADPTHKLVQAVIAFPDANAAKAFYDRQVADWNGCKNTHIKFEYQGASTEADLGVPATTAGILTMKLSPTTSATTGQQCERKWRCAPTSSSMYVPAHPRSAARACRERHRRQDPVGDYGCGGLKPGFDSAVAAALPIGPNSSTMVATPVAIPAWL
ncbi:MAG: sensor domain-containing protein [Mycobacterium sp.]